MGEVSVPLRGILIIAAAALALLCPSYAGASDVSLHGFLQGSYSLNTASENPDGSDFKWAEERLQLKLDASRGPLYLFVKTDFSYDHLEGRADAELREGYVDVVSESWDLRLGRQIITWGIGDLVFINDVFPKDFEAFFSGRPLEYLKKGVDGLKVGLYPPAASFEVVIVPFFEPNTFPRAGRFHNAMSVDAEEPATRLENTEAALRAYRALGGFDVSLYFYRGFFRMPSAAPGGGFFFPERSVYGASLEGRAAGGIVGLEAAHYDSREDRGGDDPDIPNSSTKLLASYKRQLMEDFDLALQYYAEYMHGHDAFIRTLPPGTAAQEELRHTLTLRLTRLLMHQSLRLSLFVFYSPSDEDYLLNPEVKYKFTDNIWAALGGNIFGGDARGQFGRLDRNDNVYLQVRNEF